MAAKRRAFQSTLPRRERRTARSRRPRSSYFNPRSREGSDPRVLRTRRHRPAISIHAPAKGATSSGVGLPDRPEHFNPRSREGSDTATSRETFIRLIFQSTLPRRERLLPPERTMKHRGFQSTLPRRERRRRRTMIRYGCSYFNPRSREGSDRQTAAADRPRDHFNPRSREGSDVLHPLVSLHARDFNPRSREGSDLPSDVRACLLVHFNPRSREGSDSKNHQDYSQ